MVRLENDVFLESLTELFRSNRTKGAVIMTMKRYDGKTKPVPKNKEVIVPPSKEYMCLIRAYTTGKGKKISTIVHQKDAIKFQMAYCNLLKSNIDGLKKPKKTKKTKA